MRKIHFIFFSFLFFNNSFAQNVVIRGIANNMFIGKVINAFAYDDMITYTRIKVASDTVTNEGRFELSFDVNEPKKIQLNIDALIGNMYVMPKYYYGITFPKPDSLYDLNPNAEYAVELGFIIKNSKDTMEMNSLIIDFNRQYRSFMVENYQYFIANKKFPAKIDSFQLKCTNRYKNADEPFFKTWLNYSFASINENCLRNRAWLANRYIIGKPILYENSEYMGFFNTFFKGFLQEKAQTKKGISIIDDINENGDFGLLFRTMKNDPYLQNDTLCELVTIRGLFELYFAPDYNHQNILRMLEQAGRQTSVKMHKKIIDNILNFIYKLSPGSDAPPFTLKNKKGELVSLKDFKGKYVYLDFFATWCTPCMQEMKEIADMKKKYGDRVVFVSISTDEVEEDFKKFLEKNPKYDWVFLHFGIDKNIKNKYNIKALPTYYFINQEGKLVLSPAITPKQGFELTLQEMFQYKNKSKRTTIH